MAGTMPSSPSTKKNSYGRWRRGSRKPVLDTMLLIGFSDVQNVGKSGFGLTAPFFKPCKREGKTGCRQPFLMGKRTFKRGKASVFPHQNAGFPSPNHMFSLDKSIVFRGQRQCFPCFRASGLLFSGFRSLEGWLFAPFFFQNFCKDFAIGLSMSR